MPIQNPLRFALPRSADALAGSPGTPPDRHQVPGERKWNLAELFPSDDAWRTAKAELAAEVDRAETGKGTLASSAAALAAALEAQSELRKRLLRLWSYASMRADEDTRDAGALAMKNEISQLSTDLAARSAWIDPEILALEPATLERFFAGEPRLAAYRYPISDLLRRRAHILGESEERILADAGLMADGPLAIHELLVDADLPRPEVTLSTGERVALDPSSFARHRASPVRADREQVFAAYFGGLDRFRRTFGAALDANVKRDVFFARARKYGSAVERALDGDAIPVAVYEQLIANAEAHLATFHRSLELRRRILGVERLRYSDLYAPLVAEVDRQYTIEEAERLVADACSPLGGEYVALLERAFRERWIDWLPSPGKRSGAYSNGVAVEVHPYVLMNWNGRYDDVSTLAHELGHALHSYLSNRAQPFPTARYSIFVAEVASTLDEALLWERMLAATSERDARLALLGRFLEATKGTLFRQTQFARFELEIHRAVERGEALTGDALAERYLAIARAFYGHDAGVCEVGDEVAAEWAYVPHFYYDFYVFQYATSFTASNALAERILAGEEGAVERVLELLRAGGSDDPVALLRRAGVDLTTAEPFALTLRKAERVMDEMERLL